MIDTRCWSSGGTSVFAVISNRLPPCPACGQEAVYVRAACRYFHFDGSGNYRCWLAISRGQVQCPTTPPLPDETSPCNA